MINSDGICNVCVNYSTTDHGFVEGKRKEREDDLEQALSDSKGKAEYDCVVPLSGGKDSVLLLYKLVIEYRLKVLAFTTDINIPPIAWLNIRKTLKKLDVDHVIYRPSERFYKKLFCYLLRNQEQRGAVYTISYVYAPLFEGDAIRLAIEKNIPLVLAGYSPGQPDPERMLYEFTRSLLTSIDWTPPELRSCGEFSAAELSYFYNPSEYPSGTEFPRYLAPFHAWDYDQEKAMSQVVELGLVASKKNASPIFSNYPINWLLMYSDLMHFGHNPYVPEFSALIREGKANRMYWALLGPIVDWMIRNKIFLGREVRRSLRWLGLSENELRINKPVGAYDPPHLENRL